MSRDLSSRFTVRVPRPLGEQQFRSISVSMIPFFFPLYHTIRSRHYGVQNDRTSAVGKYVPVAPPFAGVPPLGLRSSFLFFVSGGKNKRGRRHAYGGHWQGKISHVLRCETSLQDISPGQRDPRRWKTMSRGALTGRGVTRTSFPLDARSSIYPRHLSTFLHCR